MQRVTFLIIAVFLVANFSSLAQSVEYFERSFTETTSEREKFSMYLDSINVYLLKDVDVAEFAAEQCEKIIENKEDLGDSLIFELIIQKICIKQTKSRPLEAYKLILDTDRAIANGEIVVSDPGYYNYLKSFTYMTIGDIEEAQKSYYKNLDLAEENKDTTALISNYFSLGQLYNDEGEYQSSINSLNIILESSDDYEVRSSTKAQAYYELAYAYKNLELYDKAIEVLKLGSEITEKEDMRLLYVDFLIFMGDVHILRGDIAAAQEIYQDLKLYKKSIDQGAFYAYEFFKAELFRKQKMYSKALQTYEGMLDSIDRVNENTVLELLKNTEELCQEMGNYSLAHKYLSEYTDVKQRRDSDASKQKTSFLKIKYDSEKKERENKLLNAQVFQYKAEKRLMYLGLILALFILSFLAYIYYQSKRHSRGLERKVLDRTQNLKTSNDLLDKSNSELREFNRILSHDLKEPLRNIIAFSQLANKKLDNNEEAEKYLKYVLAGGKQLDSLIKGISVYQNVCTLEVGELESFEPKLLIEELLKQLEDSYPNKIINLDYRGDYSAIGSKHLVHSILYVLLDNAVKFNENNQVFIKVRHYTEEGMYNIEIEDNGIGIAERYQEHVFEMFKRLHGRKKYKGAGLGLSLAKKLTEKIDGNISILKSKEKQGSTYLFSFPKQDIDENLEEQNYTSTRSISAPKAFSLPSIF